MEMIIVWLNILLRCVPMDYPSTNDQNIVADKSKHLEKRTIEHA